MTIPHYQTLMRPLLEAAAKRQNDTSVLEVADEIAGQFAISEEDLTLEIPSGGQTIFYNRLHWARTYLGKAGLLHSPRRGRFQITEDGLALLANHRGPVSNDTLRDYEPFREWKSASRKSAADPTMAENYASPMSAEDAAAAMTPDDMISTGFTQIEAELTAEILNRLKTVHPRQFEQIVVDLLEKMGFGGKAGERAQPTRYSGDNGIDGILDEDALGLDAVYVQAKRWSDGTVGQREIQQFVGSMDGEGAHKGVFVTTSTYSKQAMDYAERRTTKRIKLIDGPKLAQLCMRYGVGVRERQRLVLWKLDETYFEDDA